MRDRRIALIDPAVELEADFLAMAGEYARSREGRYQEVLDMDFPAYVRKLRHNAEGVALECGHVPWSTFWLVRDAKRILGVSRLRHRLNAHLLRTGGHIGYDIRPSERRKGHGTRILALTLDKARARGLKRVLVTCLAENLGSVRIIESNGGVLQDQIASEEMGGALNRYWIDL